MRSDLWGMGLVGLGACTHSPMLFAVCRTPRFHFLSSVLLLSSVFFVGHIQNQGMYTYGSPLLGYYFHSLDVYKYFLRSQKACNRSPRLSVRLPSWLSGRVAYESVSLCQNSETLHCKLQALVLLENNIQQMPQVFLSGCSRPLRDRAMPLQSLAFCELVSRWSLSSIYIHFTPTQHLLQIKTTFHVKSTVLIIRWQIKIKFDQYWKLIKTM